MMPLDNMYIATTPLLWLIILSLLLITLFPHSLAMLSEIMLFETGILKGLKSSQQPVIRL